jgi:hypothetical protein
MAMRALHKPNDETVAIDHFGWEITFNLSLARRIIAERGPIISRHRLTGDGNKKLVGARAKLQKVVDDLPPAIVASIMMHSFVLEGQDRMNAVPGNPRYFPASVLMHDEAQRCVVPSSR